METGTHPRHSSVYLAQIVTFGGGGSQQNTDLCRGQTSRPYTWSAPETSDTPQSFVLFLAELGIVECLLYAHWELSCPLPTHVPIAQGRERAPESPRH